MQRAALSFFFGSLYVYAEGRNFLFIGSLWLCCGPHYRALHMPPSVKGTSAWALDAVDEPAAAATYPV